MKSRSEIAWSGFQDWKLGGQSWWQMMVSRLIRWLFVRKTNSNPNRGTLLETIWFDDIVHQEHVYAHHWKPSRNHALGTMNGCQESIHRPKQKSRSHSWKLMIASEMLMSSGKIIVSTLKARPRRSASCESAAEIERRAELNYHSSSFVREAFREIKAIDLNA